MVREAKNIAEAEDLRYRRDNRKPPQIFPEQLAVAKEVVDTILKSPRVCFQIVYGLTQAGKTGAMRAIVQQLLDSPQACADCREGIWLMTGVSSTEWVEQTKRRMPHFMRKRVVHLPDLLKLGKRLRKLQDVVLLIDEAHVAYREGMTVDKLLRSLCATSQSDSIKDLQELCRRNINIVFFTATPNRLQQEIQAQVWPDDEPCFREHVLHPGKGYTGVRELLANKQLLKYQNMAAGGSKKQVKMAKKAILRFKDLIEKRYKDSPRYHIVRTPIGNKQGPMTKRMREVLGTTDFDYEHFESRFRKETHPLNALQKMLAQRPERHTILFVKEGLRCAVTLIKTHLGVLYDRMPASSKPDGSAVIQSFAGRATGYDKHDMVVFTDIQTIKDYLSLVDSNFKDQGNFHYPGARSPTYLGASGWLEPAAMDADDEDDADAAGSDDADDADGEDGRTSDPRPRAEDRNDDGTSTSVDAPDNTADATATDATATPDAFIDTTPADATPTDAPPAVAPSTDATDNTAIHSPSSARTEDTDGARKPAPKSAAKKKHKRRIARGSEPSSSRHKTKRRSSKRKGKKRKSADRENEDAFAFHSEEEEDIFSQPPRSRRKKNNRRVIED